MSKVKLEVKKQNGGYYFPQFDIHVAAKTEKEAKELIKAGHGIDIDRSIEAANAEAKDDGQPPTNDTEVE